MSIELFQLLYLTYLTSYNIQDMYKGMAYHDLNEYIELYTRDRLQSSNNKAGKSLKDIYQYTRERYEEMCYHGINFVTVFDDFYPKDLRSIKTPPPILYYKGILKQTPNIAIVGTRDISKCAKESVKKVLSNFSKDDYGVVSGLAVGIDTIAHDLALKNDFYTIAVMPVSLEHVYPKDNYKLANRILNQSGALVSELALGINRGKLSFVERNRLQTGLSDIVIPVEMQVKSGTMHTVEFCIAQKKKLLTLQLDDETEGLPQYEGIKFIQAMKYQNKDVIGANPKPVIPQMKINPTPTLFD